MIQGVLTMVQAVLASSAAVGGLVHGEEIEVGTGAGESSNRVGQACGASLKRQAGVKNAKGRPPLDTRRHNAARWIGALSRIRADKSQPVLVR